VLAALIIPQLWYSHLTAARHTSCALYMDITMGDDQALANHIPDDVTICITSCGRLDLLAQTMASFRRFNQGGRFIISEDSVNAQVIDEVKRSYPFALVLSDDERFGIMRSIDRLYTHVTTPYIFHLEDDWVFEGPVPWQACMDVLDAHRAIANVCVRSFDEVKEKYRKRSSPLTQSGLLFHVMKLDAHPEFFSWSPNPGLIRLDLYERYKPFARVMPDQMSGVMKKDGLTMAYCAKGVARHIGHGRNVTDPTMPERPKSYPAKWLRAFKKKLYYYGLRKEPF
jgi:hypothetical protein